MNGIEIWNIVFNEFYQHKDKSFKPLEIKGIDTGMGLERLVMVAQNVPTIFDTDLFMKLLSILPADIDIRKKRILADHSRAISLIINDGVSPSNKGAGYILRRLLRRILAQCDIDEIKLAFDFVAGKFDGLKSDVIWDVINDERSQF